jgi:hypothetical protein
MCNNNNGRIGGGEVSVSSFRSTRIKNSLQKKRKMRIHHHLLFMTTQEEKYLENDNESPPPLVIIDLRELFELPSITITIVTTSAFDAKETRQAQDIQAKEKEGENMVKYIKKVAEKISS